METSVHQNRCDTAMCSSMHWSASVSMGHVFLDPFTLGSSPQLNPAPALFDSEILAFSWPKTLVIIIHSCKLPSNNFICAAPFWLGASNPAVLTTDYSFFCFFFPFCTYDGMCIGEKKERKKKQSGSWIFFLVVVVIVVVVLSCCAAQATGGDTRQE